MSAVVEYVVNSLGWSALGFVLGWLVASLRGDVRQIKEVVVPDTEQHPHHNTRIAPTRLFGVVVTVLAVLTVGQAVLTSHRIGEVAECQARYNDRFAEVTRLRTDLADDDRKALQDMLLALYRQRGANEAQRLETFRRWVETVQASERKRAMNPLPTLPKGDCR